MRVWASESCSRCFTTTRKSSDFLSLTYFSLLAIPSWENPVSMVTSSSVAFAPLNDRSLLRSKYHESKSNVCAPSSLLYIIVIYSIYGILSSGMSATQKTTFQMFPCTQSELEPVTGKDMVTHLDGDVTQLPPPIQIK